MTTGRVETRDLGAPERCRGIEDPAPTALAASHAPVFDLTFPSIPLSIGATRTRNGEVGHGRPHLELVLHATRTATDWDEPRRIETDSCGQLVGNGALDYYFPIEKPRVSTGLSMVAGAGFEPATFGL